MLAAKHPLVVPMLLRLSHFKLDSYVVLVVSRQKGITLVFKTDPLQNVDINSTFDSIAVIQKFIQREIEGQLRQMFREDLPGIIHRLSQQWVKAKVEAPYLNKRPPAPPRLRTTAMSDTGVSPFVVSPRIPSIGARSMIGRAPSPLGGLGFPRPRSGSFVSNSSVGRRPSSTTTSPETEHALPAHEGHSDGEQFDPTYGLRPEGIPQKSVFSTFRNLFSQNRGLAELAEETSDIDDPEESFDLANWEDLVPDSSFSVALPSEIDEQEYESVPAVGGGVITRPRVIHAHSQIASPSGESISGRSRVSSRTSRMSHMTMTRENSVAGSSRLARPLSASAMERAHSWAGHYNPYFSGATPLYASPIVEEGHIFPFGHDFPVSSSPPRSVAHSHDHPSTSRLGSPSSSRTRDSLSSGVTQSVATPPNPPSDLGEGVHINRPRRSSFSSNLDRFGSPPDHLTLSEHHDPKIVLKPGLNSVSRLSMLSNSNQTLSPYTRPLEHFTVRSGPPREPASSGSGSAAERQPVKAKRKRTFFLGKKSQPTTEPVTPASDSRVVSPTPMSDFDASDMDRYFRAREELVPSYSDIHPTHVRQRSRYTNDN